MHVSGNANTMMSTYMIDEEERDGERDRKREEKCSRAIASLRLFSYAFLIRYYKVPVYEIVLPGTERGA